MERVRRILMGLFYQAINQHRREAHARGIRLLKENLSSAQRAQYEKRGYFDVIGGGEVSAPYQLRNWSAVIPRSRATKLAGFREEMKWTLEGGILSVQRRLA